MRPMAARARGMPRPRPRPSTKELSEPLSELFDCSLLGASFPSPVCSGGDVVVASVDDSRVLDAVVLVALSSSESVVEVSLALFAPILPPSVVDVGSSVSVVFVLVLSSALHDAAAYSISPPSSGVQGIEKEIFGSSTSQRSSMQHARRLR